MLGLEEEELSEEIQLSAVNVTTRSKGPIMDAIILFPKIKKFKESMKKISNNTQNPLIPDLVITRQNNPTISKPMKVAESKVQSVKKISAECDMGYDIIEDIKKTKANISLFKKCSKSVTYLNREKISWNPLIHKPVRPKMMFN